MSRSLAGVMEGAWTRAIIEGRAELDVKRVRLRHGYGETVFDLVVSPDGMRCAILTATEDGQASEASAMGWDLEQGARTDALSGAGIARHGHAAFSADGRWIAVPVNGGVVLWDRTGTGEQRLLSTPRPDDGCQVAAFHPGSSRVAGGSVNGEVFLWDIDESAPKHALRATREPICGLCYHPDGSRIAVSTQYEGLQIWDLSGARRIATLASSGMLTRVAFSPDGQRVAAGSVSGAVLFADAGGGERVSWLEGHKEAVSSVAFSPDGALLASGGHDGFVRFWDASSGEGRGKLSMKALLRRHASRIVTNDSGAEGDDEDEDEDLEDEETDVPPHAVSVVAWTADPVRFIVACAMGTIWCWRTSIAP